MQKIYNYLRPTYYMSEKFKLKTKRFENVQFSTVYCIKFTAFVVKVINKII